MAKEDSILWSNLINGGGTVTTVATFDEADLIGAVAKDAAKATRPEKCLTRPSGYRCSECDKSFKELRTLRLHMKIHSSDFPEQCPICQKAFRTKWQLKQHLMDHEGGARPYPCPECSFTCKTKQQLSEHRRKHSGEKAYACQLCSTRFTYRNGLIKHTKLNRCPKKVVMPDGAAVFRKRKPNSNNNDNSNNNNNSSSSSSSNEQILNANSAYVNSNNTTNDTTDSCGQSSPLISSVTYTNGLNNDFNGLCNNNGLYNSGNSNDSNLVANNVYNDNAVGKDMKSTTLTNLDEQTEPTALADSSHLTVTSLNELSNASGLPLVNLEPWAAYLPPGSLIRITKQIAEPMHNHVWETRHKETLLLRTAYNAADALPSYNETFGLENFLEMETPKEDASLVYHTLEPVVATSTAMMRQTSTTHSSCGSVSGDSTLSMADVESIQSICEQLVREEKEMMENFAATS